MNRVNKIVSFLCVALFISYYASVTLFSHSHVIYNTVFEHSHSHTDSHHNTNSGGHSQDEIILIAQISHFDYIIFSCNCAVKPINLSFKEETGYETTHWVVSVYFQNLSLRAPPVLV